MGAAADQPQPIRRTTDSVSEVQSETVIRSRWERMTQHHRLPWSRSRALVEIVQKQQVSPASESASASLAGTVPTRPESHHTEPNRRPQTSHMSLPAPLPNPKGITMTDTDELTDEEQAATELLAQIPMPLVSDDLRAEVLRSAGAHRILSQVDTARSAARLRAQDALAAGDVPGWIEATLLLVAIQHGAADLPRVTLSQPIVDESFRTAGQHLREAQVQIPPLPVVAYTLEVNAWRSLPVPLQRTTLLPVATKPDLDGQSIVDDLAAKREQLLASVTSWHKASGQVELIGHLKAAGDHAAGCRTHAEESAKVTAVVQKVNEAHIDADLRWIPPTSISTPELKLLASL
jgi:hypothetical protein